MQLLLPFLYVIEILSAALLIGVILLQPSKGGGLGGGFGAAMGESVFGTQANRALIKFTVWMGCVFVVTTLMIAKYSTQEGKLDTGAPSVTIPAASGNIPATAPGAAGGFEPGAVAPTLAAPASGVGFGGAEAPVVSPAPAGDAPQN